MNAPRSTHILTLNPGNRFPYVLFHEDLWDDYHHKTMYDCYLHLNADSEALDLGPVKILDRKSDYTHLPDNFSSLEENYCSLGQSVEYYKTLRTLDKELQEKILTSLNDVVFNPQIAENFQEVPAFKISLLRFSEAEKAYKEGKGYLDGTIRVNVFNFTFSCKLENASEKHKIDFDFKPVKSMPYRINALIGKNGTGKTRVLANIANTMSGLDLGNGKFEPERPSFSRVIAISYSAFDHFKRPKDNAVDSDRTFSYVYCGLRSDKGILAVEDNARLAVALQTIDKLERRKQWEDILQETIELRTLLEIFKTPNPEEVDKLPDFELSSGQNIILSIITDVLVNIQPESLILFDEPEIHLHPNLISSLMRSLYKLLDEFNSYAIIATHSPLIVQQVPSVYVKVLDREGATPRIRKLGIESFGENLSTIATDIFQTDRELSNFQERLEDMTNEYTYEEILELFDNKLSLNAKIFLKTQYQTKE